MPQTLTSLLVAYNLIALTNSIIIHPNKMIMKIKKLYIACLSLAMTVSFTACGDNTQHEDTLANWKWDKIESNPDIISQGWENVNSKFGNLPTYLNVYKSPVTLDEKNVIAYIAVADMSKATFGVLGNVHWSDEKNAFGNEHLYTPSEFYSNNGSPLVVINGGLFFESEGFYYSQSSIYKDGQMLSPNQNYWSKNWTDFWYPTIGCFYQKKDGTFEATWTYYANDGKDYAYADCKKIDLTTPEESAPNSTSPSEGLVLNDGTAVNAIGGVSVLIHKGEIKNTWKDELQDVAANSQQPRTAIGYNAKDNKLIFFVCEGRNMTEGVAGLTTAQVANILKAHGCTEALNLDGGGSSCMLINGNETIKPSDGKQRAVLDGCFIK